MSVWHTITGWGIVGAVKQHTVDPFLPWYLDFPSDMAIGYLAGWRGFPVKWATWGGQPIKHFNPFNWVARHTGRLTHAGVRRGAVAGRGLVRSAARAAWKRVPARVTFVNPVVAVYTSAVALGYTIGAVIGTGISQVVWGDEGARHALDFYTGKGKYGEYFDIVGNFNTVYNALKQGDI